MSKSKIHWRDVKAAVEAGKTDEQIAVLYGVAVSYVAKLRCSIGLRKNKKEEQVGCTLLALVDQQWSAICRPESD